MNYSQILEDAWLQHCLPKANNAPTFISLFAGGGGSSLGYSMAGFRELLAVEWNNNAVEIFKLNFPDVPVYHGDIAKLSIKECKDLTGLQEGELDLLDGSPPCQGFSTSGHRNLDDSRNQLFREYIRLLKGLHPKVFVMENVSGMVKGKMKLIFAEILKQLKIAGYRVSARLMDAKYFLVPQQRKRIIIIGIRNDLNINTDHPKAMSKPISARTAIPDLIATRSQAINPWIDSSFPVATICKTEFGYQCLSSIADVSEARIKKTWQAYRVLSGQEKSKHFSLQRLNPNKPSPTIMKDAGNTCTGLIHPLFIRKLTIPEIRRLSSYPDNWQMVGNFKEKWACIGNSVPPLFMRAIALYIKKNIFQRYHNLTGDAPRLAGE